MTRMFRQAAFHQGREPMVRRRMSCRRYSEVSPRHSEVSRRVNERSWRKRGCKGGLARAPDYQ